MNWIAWVGVLIVLAILVYFMFFYGRKKNTYRKPLQQVRPRSSHTFLNSEWPSTPESRRRQKAIVDDDHTDDYLFAAGLNSAMNSEPAPSHGYDNHGDHEHTFGSMSPPDPEPIGGTSHFETGGGFGGDSGFSDGGGIGSDSGGSSDGGVSGGNND